MVSSRRLSYLERAKVCQNRSAKKLLTLMHEKQSNLAVAADVTRSDQLISLADKLGPEICLLKTHIDILEDFTPKTTAELKKIAEKQQFLIFEDRKFADIGNTVAYQYGGGMYRIADWADIINAHIVPGPGIIEGLKEIGLAKGQGLLLLAQMSSSGTLATGEYTQKAITMAKQHEDFVIGFICRNQLTTAPHFIHMTPGVQLSRGGDRLGQQYQTPEEVIQQGSDVIIVGRGIYGAKDPLKEAKLYKKSGWEAYVTTS